MFITCTHRKVIYGRGKNGLYNIKQGACGLSTGQGTMQEWKLRLLGSSLAGDGIFFLLVDTVDFSGRLERQMFEKGYHDDGLHYR